MAMTQKQFWAEIEARTSKEVADFGFSDIWEGDLPGVSTCKETAYECEDLDAAAEAARQAYEAFRNPNQ